MQDLTIALVQADQVWENKQANLSHYEHLLQDVSQVDLILLPEMFHTAFSMDAENLAETMNGMAINWLKELSLSKNTAIYTSLIVRENGLFYNRGVFVQPNGKIVQYNKRKTFGLAGEDKIYASGEEEVIVEFRGYKFQLQICYDLRFPEIVRNRLDSQGSPAYDVLLYVANWPQRRNVHWKTLLKARAIENQCYVIGVNRVGEDGKGLVYSGDSVCADALGDTVWCDAGVEQVKIVTLSKSALDEVRKALPFLRDR